MPCEWGGADMQHYCTVEAPFNKASVGPIPAVFRKQLANAQSECMNVQSPPEKQEGEVSLVQVLKVQATTTMPIWPYPPSCKYPVVCELKR